MANFKFWLRHGSPAGLLGVRAIPMLGKPADDKPKKTDFEIANGTKREGGRGGWGWFCLQWNFPWVTQISLFFSEFQGGWADGWSTEREWVKKGLAEKSKVVWKSLGQDWDQEPEGLHPKISRGHSTSTQTHGAGREVQGWKVGGLASAAGHQSDLGQASSIPSASPFTSSLATCH